MIPPTDLKAVALAICSELSAALGNTLGAGAYKQAFLIHWRGAKLALKIAPISGELRSRFERETAALKRCRHPAIAKLHHVATHQEDGCEYWVTIEEYLSGGTLSQRLSRNPFDISQIRHVGVVLANAIAHMHERSFVHRDIKPANILFRTESEPVLTDFGIVRILGAPSLTQDFMAQGPGTPLYAAPEQLLNEKASIDWRTDQFDLALVLAECILGRHPFATTGGGQRETIVRVASRAPLSEDTISQLVGAGFGCLVRALEPWPVQRYRWPTAFIEALSGEA